MNSAPTKTLAARIGSRTCSVAANGTFTAVIGCGNTQIDFSYRYDDGRLFDDEHYDFRTAKDGAIQLRSQDHTFGATGWFTLEKQ